jgi:hypothetical protein
MIMDSTVSGESTLIVLCHPRRTRRHPWRSTWGKYLVLPCSHRGRVGLSRQEHHRCQGDQRGLLGLWVPVGQGRRRDLGRLRFLLGRVDRPRQGDLARQGWLELGWLGHQVGLSRRLCRVRRAVRWGRVGLGDLHHRPFLGSQGHQVGRVGLLLRVRHLDLVGLAGMVCMVVG